MKERPILFRPEMVKAILEGRKTQTRRLIKPQPMTGADWVGTMQAGGKPTYHSMTGPKQDFNSWHSLGDRFTCPYGQPGDRLWVRETWCPGRGLAFVASKEILCAPAGAALAPGIVYKADNIIIPPGCRWRPAIHMPRWASRLTLEVVKVRVERLQQISMLDAVAEGMERWGREIATEDGPLYTTPESDFRTLWNRIHSKDGFDWNANPWLWVVEFRPSAREGKG